MIELKVPGVGESITSGILAVWLVEDGAFVTEGQEVFELETDKATMAIPAPSAGTIKILVPEGEEVEIHRTVATIDETAKSSSPPESEKPSKPEKPSPEVNNTKESDFPNNSAKTSNPDALTPAVRKLVVEENLDPEKIRGTGPGGRILKEDVLNHLKSQTPPKSGQNPLPAGSSPSGGTPQLGSSSELPSKEHYERQTRVPMTAIRKKIAERLVASKQGSAHLTTFNEVDMSGITGLRSQYKDVFEKKYGVKLGFMSFFLKAAQRALVEFPAVNAFIDGTDILYNNYVDIGVAMSTDRGLITPVLRNVGDMDFATIEKTILEFGEKAKNKRLTPDDLTGGTFTVSNGGVFGSMLSTPIPNPPQTAVLGMHTIQDRPVVRENQIVIRPMMYLALTYDHRMIDGKEAIGFLKMIKDQVEDPARMVLLV